jgi:uncharacterized lipoprotein YmbA
MNKKVSPWFSLVAVLLLGACASQPVVSSVKPEDGSIGCDQLRSELAVQLANQMAIRNCASATSAKAAAAPDNKSGSLGQDDKSAENGAVASKEARLEELKRLFYLKYLSKEAYSEMKKGILESP